MEDDTLGLVNGETQHFGQVPCDGLSFAVFIGGEPHGPVLRGAREFVHDLAFILRDLVNRREPVGEIDSQILFERSRIWPKLDLTMKSLPKNFSIVLALAGDSTITKFSCIVNRLYMRKPKYRNLGSQKAMCNCRLYFISV